MSEKKLTVLAIGGNSLIADAEHRTVADQYVTCEESCQSIIQLLEMGHRVVITHGNGPQVGFVLRRSEISADELHTVPLDSCVADTQGAIGYHIQLALYNCMRAWDKRVPVATIVSQVLVDANDPAFANPSKPIGSFMEEAEAKEREKNDGWSIVEDAGRGFRRVVPSPIPKGVVEFDSIKKLVDEGFVVVAAGGGGIPVFVNDEGVLNGLEGVIDKDRASALLAAKLGADFLLISTAVEHAYLNFGKPEQKRLDTITVAEAKQYLADGHFAPGSMAPKIEAMLEFVEVSGREAVLTDPPNLMNAVAGKTGTRIVP